MGKNRGHNRRMRGAAAATGASDISPVGGGGMWDDLTGALAADRTDLLTMPRQLQPADAFSVCDRALQGDLEDLQLLFERMAGSWPMFAQCLIKLGDAAASAPWEITAAVAADGTVPDEAAARRLVVERAWRGMSPRITRLETDQEGLVRGLAEGTVRGHVVHELLWEVRKDEQAGTIMAPRAVRMTGAQFYRWGEALRAENGKMENGEMVRAGGSGSDALLFRRGGNGGAGLEEWPEHKFLIQLCGITAGHPANASVTGLLSLFWIGFQFGWKWMLRFSERHGLPIPWATYRAGDDAARRQVCAMLAQLGSAGWGAFPSGTVLDLKEAARSTGELPQKAVTEMADRWCCMVLLGQDLTSSSGDNGSRALGEVHAGVERQRLQGVCNTVCATLNAQLVPAVLTLNYGSDEWRPKFMCEIPQPKDAEAEARRDQLLLQMGMPLPRDWLYARHGVPVPEEGEEVVEARSAESGKMENGKMENGEMENGEMGGNGGADEQRDAEDAEDAEPAAGGKRQGRQAVTPGSFREELEGVMEGLLSAAVMSGAEELKRETARAEG